MNSRLSLLREQNGNVHLNFDRSKVFLFFFLERKKMVFILCCASLLFCFMHVNGFLLLVSKPIHIFQMFGHSDSSGKSLAYDRLFGRKDRGREKTTTTIIIKYNTHCEIISLEHHSCSIHKQKTYKFSVCLTHTYKQSHKQKYTHLNSYLYETSHKSNENNKYKNSTNKNR